MRLTCKLRAPGIAWSLAIALVAPFARGEEPTALPPLPPLPPPLEPTPAPSPAAPLPDPTPTPVTPAPATPATWHRQPVLTGGVILGIGTPAGWVGGTLSFSPIDRVAIAAEVGLGTNGVQTGLMLHAYPIDTARDSGAVGRAGAGLGVSTGTYADRNVLSSGNDKIYFRRAWFLNAEASMLAWHRVGFEVEAAIGAAILLNRGDGICTGARGCAPLGLDPYVAFRIRFGGWL